MIEELGLAHARNRIDLAVFNGHLHGYEIKSSFDTLNRLPNQLSTYCAALQKLTLVVAARHFSSAAAIAPEWCGLIEIVEGSRGGMLLKPRRRSNLNPNLDPFVLAHLLWRSEAQELLNRHGAHAADLNLPRKQLYKLITETLSIQELAASIKAAMASRTGWRDQPPLS